MVGCHTDIGSLHEGAYADVVAMRANPLDDITELTRVAMVVANGRVIRNDLRLGRGR